MQTNKKIALSFAALGLILGGAGTIALQTHAASATSSTTTTPASSAAVPSNEIKAEETAVTPAIDKETNDAVESGKEANDSAADQAVIAKAQIDTIAANKAAGVPDGTVSSAKLENENGQPVYKVKFQSNGVENEVSVDAITGKVLKTENEQDEKQGVRANDTENESNNQSSQADQAN